MLHRRTFAPVKAVDPDAALEDLVSGELFDLDLEDEEEAGLGQRLMCVVAHPDDECFAFGGALALAADRGIETYVVCLTDGQAATNRGSCGLGMQSLERMRRAEFAASCEVLGVTHHELLDYQDAQL